MQAYYLLFHLSPPVYWDVHLPGEYYASLFGFKNVWIPGESWNPAAMCYIKQSAPLRPTGE